MPERPELDYVVPILARELVGRRVDEVQATSPVALRVLAREPLDELVKGGRITAIRRALHVVIIALDRGVEIAIAPMLAGRFSILAPSERAAKKRPSDLALVLGFDDGRELRYRDDVQMGKVYVARTEDRAKVPGLAKLGVDVLGPAFTKEAFRALAKTRRDQAKVFLLDKSALDAMGNAYADEVLFEAQIHPKTMVKKLDAAALDRLHDAIVRVLANASAEVQRRAPPIDQKVRDFLAVRNRHGEPCPRCGTTIRRAGVHGHDAFFCPVCQPDDRGSAIVDWRKVKP